MDYKSTSTELARTTQYVYVQIADRHTLTQQWCSLPAAVPLSVVSHPTSASQGLPVWAWLHIWSSTLTAGSRSLIRPAALTPPPFLEMTLGAPTYCKCVTIYTKKKMYMHNSNAVVYKFAAQNVQHCVIK